MKNTFLLLFAFSTLIAGAFRVEKTQASSSFDPAVVVDMNLTSMCSENPATFRRWRVSNPNGFNVAYTWKLYGTAITGAGVATPGMSYFFTPAQAGANTTIITWKNELNADRSRTKASGGVTCPPDPTLNCKFSVECFQQGPNRAGGAVVPSRSDVSKTIVAEKSDSPGPINFYALGFGGFVTLKSSCPVKNGAGNDITLFETTWGSPAQYPTGERALVYASQDGINYVSLGLAVYNASFDLGAAGLSWARYFRIQDVSNQAEPLNPGDDAFDVDGIAVLNGFTAEDAPTPNPNMGPGVYSYCGGTQGKTKAGNNVPAIRSDVTKAFGVPQNNDTYNFYSLGMGGDACFKFGYAVFDMPGPDIQVVETSFGSPACPKYPEKTEVFVSYDGSNWNSLGILCLDGTVDLTLANSGISYIKLVDVSNPANFGGAGDGFDIDAILGLGSVGNTPPCPQVTNGRQAVSEPIVFADQNGVPDEIESLQVIGNPVADQINLRFTMVAENAELIVHNHMGQQIISQSLNSKLWDLKEINLSAEKLAPGVYFVTLDSKVSKETVKFVKK
jgi:hypothetical protein